MEDELENIDSLNDEETLDSNLEQESDESTEDFQERIAKAEEIAKNQKIRAEKAEAELKALKKPQSKTEKETPKNTDGLSTMDVLSLVEVPKEDREYLLDEAKDRGKSVAELLKDPYMQVVLKAKEEERATANATSTASTKRGSRRDSDETILRNFEQGKVSEKDEDIQKLVEAELNLKRAIAKGN